MKRLSLLLLTAALFCACNNNSPKTVCPLPAGIDLSSSTDYTIAAVFSAKDFDWVEGTLSFTAYSEDIYDAVDLLTMQPGDTLIYDGEKIVVEKLIDEDGFLTVNCDLDEGGAWLQSNGGGTYRAIQFDDHSMYSLLGETQLRLSDDWRIVDCGLDPLDPSETIATGHKQYLESLPDWRQEFSCLDTRITLENGVITEIVRVWIP